jgi:phosphoribulokinase
MSASHPIIAVIGASGAGKTIVKQHFYDLFKANNLAVAIIEGDSFHRYSRKKMLKKQQKHKQLGRSLTHYSHHANNLKQLEQLFQEYSQQGTGKRRFYVHNDAEAERLSKRFNKIIKKGELSPLEDLPTNTKALFYEGLHGGAVDEDQGINVAKLVDFLIGVVPTINLEWKQKITRDVLERGYSREQVIDSITERLPDYIDFIIPQFSRTHLNIQYIPLMDTSNPFADFTGNEKIGDWTNNALVAFSIKDNRIDIEKIKASIKGAKITKEGNIIIDNDKLFQALDVIVKSQLSQISDNFNF